MNTNDPKRMIGRRAIKINPRNAGYNVTLMHWNPDAKPRPRFTAITRDDGKGGDERYIASIKGVWRLLDDVATHNAAVDDAAVDDA